MILNIKASVTPQNIGEFTYGTFTRLAEKSGNRLFLSSYRGGLSILNSSHIAFNTANVQAKPVPKIQEKYHIKLIS